ncbi:MAG: prepilin-type N-terminal cleavage/methylation domain-containing protein [Patescibacteria group bacterium]|nr:prepilin-type N-terminal cleavage/methylation domain-containing protein [Patescibacteria group bacterium]
MYNMVKEKNKGFTLLELLIVIAVLAVLAGVLFVALDPAARLQDSRNAKRWTDVNAVLSAIKLDQVDNGGSYHANITAMTDNTYYQIGEAATGCDDACANPSVALQAACVDLLDLIDEGYLADVPIDPNASGKSSNETGYYLYKYDSGQISVGSCHEELGSNSSVQAIEVSR